MEDLYAVLTVTETPFKEPIRTIVGLSADYEEAQTAMQANNSFFQEQNDDLGTWGTYAATLKLHIIHPWDKTTDLAFDLAEQLAWEQRN